MTALLDGRETMHFPQFADWDFEEINGDAELKKIKEEAARPLVAKPERPLPFFHWSHFASLRDARLRCAERSLSESDSDDVKLAIMREALEDFSVPVVSKPWVPLKVHQKRGDR